MANRDATIDRLTNAAQRVGRLQAELATATAEVEALRVQLSHREAKPQPSSASTAPGGLLDRIANEPAHSTTKQTLAAMLALGGSVRPGSLAKHMGITRAAVAQRVKRLKKIGLVQKIGTGYSLTESGRQIAKEGAAAA